MRRFLLTILLPALAVGCSDGGPHRAAAPSSPPPAPATASTTRSDSSEASAPATATTPSGPVTSGPVTSRPVTSRPVTSGPVTSGPVASGDGATGSPIPATFTETPDVRYMTSGRGEMAVDIYAPDGGGPWPVVVAFHGISSATRAAETNTVVAEAAAARGMVVFAPTWIVGEPFPITIDSLRSMRSSGSCALAFAQQHAAEYGGDPARTVVYGFSAGTGPALLAAVAPSTGPIPGCGSGGTPAPVAGVVLGDGEYFWHSENFDDAFRDDPSATRAELARLVDPAGWRDDVDAGFSLWAAADGTAPRSVGDPQDAAGWLAVRDPDGSIRSDLRSLGLLDDGVVTDVDSGRLLAFRLSGAGLDVTWRTYPGGHTTLDKVPEIVAELRTAAGG